MSAQDSSNRSRTVTWQDPMPGASAALNMSGLEYLQGIVSGQFPPPPIAELMGMTLSELDEGRVVFVAYADVRRPQGWLVQGVYTWPEVRRRGFARRGMDSVVREAFASGAAHVQLAVIEGNESACSLYHELGFEAFAELRTVLFS